MIEQLIDAPPIDEILIKISQFMHDPEIINGQQFPAFLFPQRVNIELKVVLKEPPK